MRLSTRVLGAATHLEHKAWQRGVRYPWYVHALDWIGGRLTDLGL